MVNKITEWMRAVSGALRVVGGVGLAFVGGRWVYIDLDIGSTASTGGWSPRVAMAPSARCLAAQRSPAR